MISNKTNKHLPKISFVFRQSAKCLDDNKDDEGKIQDSSEHDQNDLEVRLNIHSSNSTKNSTKFRA